MANGSSDKICPRCGTRYDGDAAFCPKDGSTLQLVSPPVDPLVGQVLLGQFRIDEPIGSGGMGVVYRARQLAAGRDVAIKVVQPELAASPEAFRRFEREARICGSLDHPNVVRAFLSGQLPDGSLYLVMELLQGRTLADLLRVEPVIALPRAVHILTQIADGIGAAHERNIVHRDVKPENVFLVTKSRDPDTVKVLDFGIARTFDRDEGLTVAGLVLGTALYISPEAAAGSATDPRSDVYSLGVLAYRVLAGVMPFDASSPAQLLLKHLHQPAPPLVAQRGGPAIPQPLVDVVMRALSKTPSERWEDANDFAQALRDAALEAGIEWRRPRTGAFRVPTQSSSVDTRALPRGAGAVGAVDDVGLDPIRPSWITLGVAFVVGALAVLGFYLVWPHGSAEPASAQIRAESVKSAELALAEHRWDGPTGVRATTDALLAARSDDPDALRIRRDAATLLVAEGDQERAAGHAEVARARYDAALELLVNAPGDRARLVGIDTGEGAHTEQIVAMPAPVAGEPVMITATLSDTDLPGARPRFVFIRDGQRLAGPLDAVRSSDRTYAASHTFQDSGIWTVEFRVGTGTSGYAFRTNVVVAPPARTPPSVPAPPPT
jgi:serine/threonine protein kinase